jgi:hypothetical protein
LLDVATPQRVVVVVPDEENRSGSNNDKGGGTGSEVTVVIPGGKFLKRRLLSPSANCSSNTHHDDIGAQNILAAAPAAAAGNATSSITAREVRGQKDMPSSASSSDRDDDGGDEEEEKDSGMSGSGNATGVVPSSSSEAISALTAKMMTHSPTVATNIANNFQKPATILRGEQNAAAAAEISGGDLDYDQVSVPTAKSIQQIVDKDDERVTGPITSADASVGNVCTATTNDHTDAKAEAIGSKYILCHSMFSGVEWEEVPVNEGASLLCPL